VDIGLCKRILPDIPIQIPARVTHLSERIAADPPSCRWIIGAEGGEVQAAVAGSEEARVAEVGDRRGRLEGIAIGVVVIGGRGAVACKDAADGTYLIETVVERFRRATCAIFALVEIAPCDRSRRIACLTERQPAPEIGGCDRRPARWCRSDRRAAAKAIVAEAQRLAGAAGRRHTDQSVLGVPGVGPRTVGGQVAVCLTDIK
jgi:hypothetical protein